MALSKTTLAAAIKPNDLVFSVASTATGFPAVGQIITPSQPILIDQEMMFLVQVNAPGLIQVRSRGSDGTLAVAHDITAPVVTSASPGDFLVPTAGFMTTTPLDSPRELTYGQSGTIVPPSQPNGSVAILNGPAAIAMTLAAPTPAIIGATLNIFTQTAFAHTISAPGLLLTGAAGGPFSTITFPAQIGAQVDLTAQGTFWSVSGVNGAVVFT